MEFISQVVDIFLHLDRHLGQVITDYGTLTYLILFLIIFCETGLVVTPFLPGDSLIFVAGTFAALGALDIWTLWIVLCAAPILGDSTNYWIGRYIGPKVFASERSRLLNKQHLHKTHMFYEKHGGKTVIIARFMPIFRTFAPFVAGVGSMNYPRFLMFSIGGTLLWISSFVFGGYFFGNIPVVRENFTLVVMAIIAISFVPPAIQMLKSWMGKKP